MNMKKTIISLLILTGSLLLTQQVSAQNSSAKTTSSDAKPQLAKDKATKVPADANKPTPPLSPEANMPVTGNKLQQDAKAATPDPNKSQSTPKATDDKVPKTEYKEVPPPAVVAPKNG
jgi:hypothetical protein